MRVRYVYSACVVIETEDVRILTDPWFSDGAYYGSWYQYPVPDRDPVEIIGPVDLIYISHLHPDHYDPKFLRRYLATYPSARIVVPSQPALMGCLKRDGFEFDPTHKGKLGRTEYLVAPNLASNDGFDIDSALAVKHGSKSVIDMNDCPYDENQVAELLEFTGQPTCALLPYSGAGPWPQCYYDDREKLIQAAAEKRELTIGRFQIYNDRIRPLRAIPFAGEYWLGGKLAELNQYRGVPDATELLDLFPNAVVLADGGGAYLDLETLTPSAVRTEPYNQDSIDSIMADAATRYDYEIEISPLRDLPLIPLLKTAYYRALEAVRSQSPGFICIRVPGHNGPQYVAMDITAGLTNGVAEFDVVDDISSLMPRWEFELDPRLLFGLLTRMYHWNNAEIGSHYRVHRVPDEYRRDIMTFLWSLHV